MAKEDIKFAKPEDIPQIVALGYKSFNENDLSDLPFQPDFDKGLLSITEAVMQDVVLVKRNKENDKVIDGVFVLKIGTTWFSQGFYLCSLLWYIKPELRTFSLAKDFLNAAKEYAIIKGLPISLNLYARKDIDKKIKLLKYMGFKEVGTSLVFLPPRS